MFITWRSGNPWPCVLFPKSVVVTTLQNWWKLRVKHVGTSWKMPSCSSSCEQTGSCPILSYQKSVSHRPWTRNVGIFLLKPQTAAYTRQYEHTN